ncbi:MAG: hypothetical protein SynsKO_45470 [Synoicihabitans sp.]
MRPKIHAFDGKTGAGKTTLSKKLAKELKAYRVSHDELLTTAYEKEHLERHHTDCCRRANDLAWKIIERVTALGVDVVMEGWSGRELRDQIREKARELDLDVEFYFVSCPQEERLKRIKIRNDHAADDAPYISDENFSRMEGLDDDFGDDEDFTEVKNGRPIKSPQPTAASRRG